MSDHKNLFIVGAGASAEFGLPVGQQLKTLIATSLDIRFKNGQEQISGDPTIYAALRLNWQMAGNPQVNINEYLGASRRISSAMPQAMSIDNFIHNHQDDPLVEVCGKLAIVKAILDAERQSTMYINPLQIQPGLNFGVLENTWLSNLFKLIIDDCRKDEVEERLKKIAFIVFNYDRCLEHYLFHALQNYYGFNADKAAQLIQNILIYHPYGVVGELPWQAANQPVYFGGTLQPKLLQHAAKGIKTFTEGTDPESSEIIQIREIVRTASKTIFLGFAFHNLNLQLLNPNDGPIDYNHRLVFGTAFGMSEHDRKVIEGKISGVTCVHREQIHLRHDLKCDRLFQEYSQSISLTR